QDTRLPIRVRHTRMIPNFFIGLPPFARPRAQYVVFPKHIIKFPDLQFKLIFGGRGGRQCKSA
ncbi:MAG: hypothetical protein IIZ93_09560, partial [Acidaminococcaceae bacterium]|nr:hypothetical protein [Acidaminococcaceae bacterium]